MLASPQPWIVGHRGAAGERPENTLAGIHLARAQRADMVELDFQLTSDGELVAVHDWEVELPSGRVVIEAQQAPLLRGDPENRDPASPFPTLAEVLAEIDTDLPLNLEIKRRTADAGRLVRRLADLLGASSGVVVSSFDWGTLELVRDILPRVPVAPLAKYTAEGLLEAAARLEAVSIHCRQVLVEPGLIADARRDRRPVLAFTVNRSEDARRLFEMGLAGVFTDFPGRLRQELSATGLQAP